jgi:chloride channel 7
VGAASALAGMFRSSISLVVIVVEGTCSVGALTPLIVGVAVANLVGPKVHGESFYDAQLRAKGVPFLRHHHACAPTEGDVDDTTLDDTSDEEKTFEKTFGARRVVASLVVAPPRCLSPAPLVGDVVAALKSTTHNGFPVVISDASEETPFEDEFSDAETNAETGRLVGFILRSQLMVLLARRAFVSAEARADAETRFFPDDGDAYGAPFERLTNAHVEATDAAMRTFHHRHHFGDRGVSCSAAAVERLGLSRREMATSRVDLRDYMKIAPLAVHAECSAWRAAGYFINAGLRHLPVVDAHNRVVGVLTRRDLVPGFASAARAERDDASPEKRTVSP